MINITTIGEYTFDTACINFLFIKAPCPEKYSDCPQWEVEARILGQDYNETFRFPTEVLAREFHEGIINNIMSIELWNVLRLQK